MLPRAAGDSSVSGGVQGQAGFQKHGLVQGISAHGKGVGTR